MYSVGILSNNLFFSIFNVLRLNLNLNACIHIDSCIYDLYVNITRDISVYPVSEYAIHEYLQIFLGKNTYWDYFLNRLTFF